MPRQKVDLPFWVPELGSLAADHGVDRIRQACLDVFGFPPELVQFASEISQVRRFLRGSS